MERQNVSNLNPKNEAPFYSRWWGNITNYLEGWKNYFWNMFNPKSENSAPSQKTPSQRNETTRVTHTASALEGFVRDNTELSDQEFMAQLNSCKLSNQMFCK